MSESPSSSFWSELIRRKVVRTGLSYSITAWLLIQVFDIALPTFGAPAWVLKVIIAVLAAGLPVALVLAWSFDIKSATSENGSPRATKKPGLGINAYLIAVLTVAIGYILFDTFSSQEEAIDSASSGTAAAYNDKSIAVLPFKNLSSSDENLYFSDGIMEAILNELSLIRDLKVISRTSVEGYRDTTKPVPQIGQELDVAHVLEGSVQRAGDKVRVTAQLIATANDKHLWSRNYDRAFSDIFVIQSEIADAISSNLELILTSEEQQMMVNAPTSELRAYDLYLRGNYRSAASWSGDRNIKEVRESLRFCEQAAELDPEFALAYTCIAASYFELGVSDYVAMDDWLPFAKENAERALQIDPDTWLAYDVLANINRNLSDLNKVAMYTRKILDINPNQPDYLADMAFWEIIHGDKNEGMDLLLRSLELIPGEGASFDLDAIVNKLFWLAPDLASKMIGTEDCLSQH